ncbi:hypothetical protein ANCCEY_07870 [Ancylostoma ceylanicum]|uniref:G-protein coupled receptors family 1 profile domain-containing protein n=1 Tax=Ancylostoma ceylanicum TaxID=53326 RepID=A0A0D6LLV2_9BILA|nr:hypothetical protein ANCCEY_07870 [Ancylostoma ceylanicum]
MLTLMADLAPTIIPIVILYFEVLGIFGNVNLILATIRKKHLQTKHGVLLALTSFYQLMCLLGELVNVSFALSGVEIKRNMCFILMSPYLVFSCLQSTMFLVLALDVLIAILFPLKHMVTRLGVYVSIASIPAVVYAVLILSLAIAGMISMETNPRILLCNPPLSVHPKVASFWINWNGFSNLGVLVIYVAVYAVVSSREKPEESYVHCCNIFNFMLLGHYTNAYGSDKRERKMGRIVMHSAERKVLISLLWLITVFASTWCTCNIILAIAAWFEQTQDVAAVQSYVVVFALMAYSVNYYVYFTKNHAYRRVFLEQLAWIFPKRFFNGIYWNETGSRVGALPSLRTPAANVASRIERRNVGNGLNSSTPRRL